ncbi:EAL domain-containing protein [Vibrio vulnificus]|nr:EAL domain-containing protein [Vibrio vulnificus]
MRRYANGMAALALAVLLLTAALSLVGTAAVTKYFYDRDQTLRIGYVSRYLDRIDTEISDILTTLNALGHSECSNDTLRNMQRQLFSARYVNQIRFIYHGSVSCDTAFGFSRQSTSIGEPDAIIGNDYRVWFLRPLSLDSYLYGHIIQHGQYSVVVGADKDFDRAFDDVRWQLAAFDGEQYYPYAGNANIPLTLTDLPWFYYRTCNRSQSLCFAMSLPWQKVVRDNFSVSLISLMLCVFIGFVASRYTAKSLKRRRSVEYRVKQGMRDDHFYFLYQPIVNLETGQIVGAEVLARFKDKHGELSPDEFIPYIAELGLTWSFTLKMFDRVMTEFNAMPDGVFNRSFKLNFNVFPCDVNSGRVRQLVNHSLLSQRSFSPALEITEHQLLASECATNNLNHVISEGYELVIDDFGTGYSNLQQLTSLRHSRIKIDRSFVSSMDSLSIRSSFIPHIVDIAATSGACVVAEGIETEFQLHQLKALHVQYGQGYLFSRPIPLLSLYALLVPINDAVSQEDALAFNNNLVLQPECNSL